MLDQVLDALRDRARPRPRPDAARPDARRASPPRVLAGLDERARAPSAPTGCWCRATPPPPWPRRSPPSTAASASATSRPGLRTGDLPQPFPEEINRRVVDRLADAALRPHRRAPATRCSREGVPRRRAIHVTGNTGDRRAAVASPAAPAARAAPPGLGRRRPSVLVTAHRRESFGAPLPAIFAALRDARRALPRRRLVYPVHRNPNVQRAGPSSCSRGLANVELLEPLDYRDAVAPWRAAAWSSPTPAASRRRRRPSASRCWCCARRPSGPRAIEAGVARLVGTDRERIVAEASAAARPIASRVPRHGAARQPLRRRPRGRAHRRHPRGGEPGWTPPSRPAGAS